MEEVIEMIEDKIREAEEYGFEDTEISEQYLAGYISGLNHTKTILLETQGLTCGYEKGEK